MNVPDNDRENQETFLELLKRLDPELYMIKQALLESRINPMLLVYIIRNIGNLLIGTGYGTIKIYMQKKKINNIVGEEKTVIEEETIVE
jgi:hypothetical protein